MQALDKVTLYFSNLMSETHMADVSHPSNTIPLSHHRKAPKTQHETSFPNYQSDF